MNAQNLAASAYAAAMTPTKTHSANEYDAFARVTARLKSANTVSKASHVALAQAIHQNRELWTLLAVDVASGDNLLPETLRAQIFYLAEFTGIHSRKVLRGEATCDALIDINTSIMRGLRQQADAT